MVSELEGRNEDLALSDTEGTDSDRFPARLALKLIKELGARNTTGGLLAEVGVREFLSQTEAHYIFSPKFIAMPEILILFAVTVFLEQVTEGTPEIGVTALLDCSIQRNR